MQAVDGYGERGVKMHLHRLPQMGTANKDAGSWEPAWERSKVEHYAAGTKFSATPLMQ